MEKELFIGIKISPKLQRELESIAARTDARLRIARKKRWKQIASVARQKSRP